MSNLADIKQTQAGIIVEELEVLKTVIAGNIMTVGANASGRTIGSMYVEASEEGGTLFGRKAFGTLETGRRGGRIPFGFHRIILQWMRDKGVSGTPIPYKRQPSERWQPKYTPQQRGDMSLAWHISQKIKREGTYLFRAGGRDTVYSQAINKTMERIADRLMPIVEAEVMESIKINTTTIGER